MNKTSVPSLNPFLFKRIVLRLQLKKKEKKLPLLMKTSNKTIRSKLPFCFGLSFDNLTSNRNILRNSPSKIILKS